MQSHPGHGNSGSSSADCPKSCLCMPASCWCWLQAGGLWPLAPRCARVGNSRLGMGSRHSHCCRHTCRHGRTKSTSVTAVWDDPEEFQPERFPLHDPVPTEQNTDYRYIPFSAGPRCLLLSWWARNAQCLALKCSAGAQCAEIPSLQDPV